MAKGQMRSTKEKKKPKADKDKPKQLSAYKLSQMQGSSASPYGNPPGKKSSELLAAHCRCFRLWRKLLCLLCHFQAGEQLHVTRWRSSAAKPAQCPFCAALYWAQSCSSLLRASRSSRWQAAESRPGISAASAAGRHVRSRSNFGMELAARTRSDAVKTIGNKAGIS